MGSAGLIAAAGSMLAIAGPATATPGPVQLAGNVAPGAPATLVDSKGTVNLVWLSTNNNQAQYARRAAGARKFTRIALPSLPDPIDNPPVIYQTSPGTLVILVGFGTQLSAAISTNDGISWTTVDTSALEALAGGGEYISSEELTQGPHGALGYAGNTGAGGPIVGLGANLDSVSTLGTLQPGINNGAIVQTNGGTPFVLGTSATSDEPAGDLLFQVGSGNLAAVTFPCAADNNAGTHYALAAEGSGAVVAFAGCGSVWTRTLSASGAVGRLVRVTSGPVESSTYSTVGDSWVALSSSGSHVTLAYRAQGGDLGIASSSNGTSWSVARGLLPLTTNEANIDGYQPTLAAINASWIGYEFEPSNNVYAIRAVPVTSTYRVPAYPSARGLAGARRLRLGSLSVTSAGRVGFSAFRKHGKISLRLTGAIADSVGISLEVSTAVSGGVTDLCGADVTTRLRPGHARTVTLTCTNDSSATRTTAVPDLSRHSKLTIELSTRNGDITYSPKLG